MNNLTGYALQMDVGTPVIASNQSSQLLTWFLNLIESLFMNAENTEVICHTEKESLACKNMKEYGQDMEYERYKCDVCGRKMKLDYDEMR